MEIMWFLIGSKLRIIPFLLVKHILRKSHVSRIRLVFSKKKKKIIIINNQNWCVDHVSIILNINFYLDTGFGSEEGKYSVTFVRDSELSESSRNDVHTNCRNGACEIERDLLRYIEVRYIDQMVRSYELMYLFLLFPFI